MFCRPTGKGARPSPEARSGAYLMQNSRAKVRYCQTFPFQVRGGNVRHRLNLVLATRSGDRLLSEPTALPRPRRTSLHRTDIGRSALVAGTSLHAPYLTFGSRVSLGHDDPTRFFKQPGPGQGALTEG